MIFIRMLLCFSLAVLSAGATTADKDRARLIKSERFAFATGGELRLRDSFGEVHVEGWDRDEAEVVVEKSTRKEYARDREQEAMRELDRVTVSIDRPADNQIVVTTVFPSRNLVKRPLKGKSNVELIYRIKVPQRTYVSIKHDVGEVTVSNILADIGVTNRVGEVTLHLPEDQEYVVDARTRIGDVNSDFDGCSRRQSLLGEHHSAAPTGATHQLYLRVGIGEIGIRKLPEWVKKDTTII